MKKEVDQLRILVQHCLAGMKGKERGSNEGHGQVRICGSNRLFALPRSNGRDTTVTTTHFVWDQWQGLGSTNTLIREGPMAQTSVGAAATGPTRSIPSVDKRQFVLIPTASRSQRQHSSNAFQDSRSEGAQGQH